MYEVFISYEHESKTIADSIVSYLENRKIRCWYAPRDVIGDYATSIVNAIKTVKVFVVIISENSSKSPHVLNEVEMAYKKVITDDIIILPFKIDNANLSLAMEYYVKRMHWIDAYNKDLQLAISELSSKIELVLGKKPEVKSGMQEKHTNEYYKLFAEADDKEAKRLKVQSRIIQKFDQPVFDKAIIGFANCKVLDIGSNDGTSIMDRFGNKDEVVKIYAVDIDKTATQKGAEKYKNEKITFYNFDLSQENIGPKIEEFLQDNNITEVDVLVFSFILLHLKNQYQIVKAFTKVLKPGGRIIVGDVDDSLIFAYPDPNGIFSKFFSIREKSEFGGFRRNGRTINSLLQKCGYENIELAKVGLTPLGLSFEERSGFYDMCFSYIYDDTKRLLDKYPSDKELAAEYQWMLETRDEIEEGFMDKSFFYMDSTMIFLANKPD